MNSQEDSSEDFGSKLGSVVTNGFTCISIAMGAEVGLFDVLADCKEPKTSQELAQISGMKERYIREWLGAMVTAGIVDIDSSGERFSLPAHRIPYLTKNGSKNVMTCMSRFIANLTTNAFYKVKDCFPEDGPSGTAYADYPGKFEITADSGAPWAREHLVDSFISSYPVLKTQLENGISVLDVGCGMGLTTLAMARAFPKSKFCGVDFLEINFLKAKQEAESEGLVNCEFFAQDVEKLPEEWTGRFEFVFMHYVLHDLAHPIECLKVLRRVLASGGRLTVVDCNGHSAIKDNKHGMPGSEMNYTASLLACLPLSLGVEGGAGLGAACGKEKFIELFNTAGYEVEEFDVAPEDSSEDFGTKLGSIVTNGFTCISIAMGAEVGLFDVLADCKEPKTSQELAQISGMKERYIREWLGAMVTAGIVDIDSSGERFSLPAHRIPYLTKNGSKNVMTCMSRFIANVTTNAFYKVKDCFPEDGPSGTSYADYPGKFEILADAGAPWAREHLVGSFISSYPVLKTQLENGICVLDVGCGMGVTTLAMARAFPKSKFCGVDFLEINFLKAKQEAESEGLVNCEFFAQDVEKLPEQWTGRFDFVFMHNVLHDLAHPIKCLKVLRRVLARGGRLTVVECNSHSAIKDNLHGMPRSEMRYGGSLLSCLPLSLGVEGGAGLGTACGKEKFIDLLNTAGFEVEESDITPGTNSASLYFHCILK
ncbi:putative methyltransferase C1B3.06c [Holothuria leucospilota]|uniref:Methyltransferase C1B3.06c n=1 Tax=Holothuria leucospilota TaxID=206669 RepID=A0A9Q1BLZ0_HOLLE|nr:putative methyltransferase C1B3.06c [Holothuria leucospilota]